MIEIVIKIPDKLYEYIVKGKDLSEEQNDEMAIAIEEGTPLPKGHGRLIDGDSLMERFENEQDYYDKSESPLDELSIAFDNGIICAMEKLDETPSIIEADKYYRGR